MVFLLSPISMPRILRAEATTDNFYSLSAPLLSGDNKNFSEYKGKVVLISNIALACGTTPQLKALQQLYTEFGKKGLVVLGFPSNDITGEDMKDKNAIRSFCTKYYSITFPIFSPGGVTGTKPQPVFEFLTQHGPDETKGEVDYNFEKFIVDKKGDIRARYGSFTSAQSQVLKTKLYDLLAEVQ
jgi:glutathione peroxidase